MDVATDTSVAPNPASLSAGPSAAVARAWSRVLDRASFENDTPFDEAGGDSLRLLKFVFYVEEDLGTTLPLDLFDLGMRPGVIAGVIGAHMAGVDRASSDRPVLFLLTGLFGDEPRLVRFREACASELDIITLDYGDWSDWTARDYSYVTLVERVIADIIARAPHGKLLLAGYSLGGVLVHEVARRLHAAERDIAFLGILDTNMDGATQHSIYRVGRHDPTTEWRQIVDGVRTRRPANALGHFCARRLTGPRWALLLRLLARRRQIRWPGEFGFYLHWYLRARMLAAIVGVLRAELEPAPASARWSVVLFRAAERRGADDDLGWRALNPGVTVVPVDGGHNTMFDAPNLSVVVEKFLNAVRVHTGPTAQAA